MKDPRFSPALPKKYPRNPTFFPCITANSYIYCRAMSLKPSPLADQLAGLRAATTANAERGWLPASLHALIMAIFARIFGRLEQLLLLWQSGTLPAAQPATANATAARTARPPAQQSNPATPRAPSRARPSPLDTLRPSPARRPPACAIDTTPSATPAPNWRPRIRTRIRSSRAPPARSCPKTAVPREMSPCLYCFYIVIISQAALPPKVIAYDRNARRQQSKPSFTWRRRDGEKHREQAAGFSPSLRLHVNISCLLTMPTTAHTPNH